MKSFHSIRCGTSFLRVLGVLLLGLVPSLGLQAFDILRTYSTYPVPTGSAVRPNSDLSNATFTLSQANAPASIGEVYLEYLPGGPQKLAATPTPPVASFQADFMLTAAAANDTGLGSSVAFNLCNHNEFVPRTSEAGGKGGVVISMSYGGSVQQHPNIPVVSVAVDGSIVLPETPVPLLAGLRAVRMQVQMTQSGALTLVCSQGAVPPTVLLDAMKVTWRPSPTWRFGFCGESSGLTTLQGAFIGLQAKTLPFIVGAPVARSSFQDQSDSYEIDVLSWEVPPGQATLQVSARPVSGNLVPAIQVTRQLVWINDLTFTSQRGTWGVATVELVAMDPTGGRQSYIYNHTVFQNVPPTLDLGTPINQPAGFTHARTIGLGSMHWPVDQVNVVVDQFPQELIDPRSIFIMPDADGRNLVFTSRPDARGTGDIVVRATDPSGDTTTARLTVTFGDPDPSPVVIGAGTAISLNTATDRPQYVYESGTSPGTDAGANATVEAWVFPVSMSDATTGFIAHMGQTTASAGLSLILQTNGMPGLLNGGNNFLPTNATATAMVGTWHHLAAVVNGTQATLYVDGKQAARGTLAQPPNILSGPIYIGAEPPGGAGRRWVGHLDEVRLWNTSRTAADIAASFNRGVGANTPGLLRYFRFEEGFTPFQAGPGGDPAITGFDSARVTDSSVNQRPLVSHGFPAYVPGVPLATQVDVEQEIGSTFGIASVVEGLLTSGNAGVLREIHFGPNTNLLGAGLAKAPGWSNNPSILVANGMGLEVPPGEPSNYAERIRGFLRAPETGTYKLSIASLNEGELWMSDAAAGTNLRVVAKSPATGVGFRQFDAFPDIQSVTLSLVADKEYYFEVRRQVASLGTIRPHLSVQWTLPNGTTELPIPAYRIRPIGTSQSVPILYSIDLTPIYGKVTLTNDLIQYQPIPNYFGPDSIAVTVQHGAVRMPPALIELNVLNRTPAPVAGSIYALQLGGSPGGVELSPGFDLGGRSFTIELWAKRADSTPGNAALVHLQPESAPDSVPVTFGWFSNGVVGVQWTNSLPSPDFVSGATYLDTNWHHYALVIDMTNGRREIFRDGVSLGSVTGAAEPVTASSLYIGSIAGESAFFQGSVDEFRVWTRARTGDEIFATMNTPLVGNEDDLLLYYRFDEGNGLIALDATKTASGLYLDADIRNPVQWTTNAPVALAGATVGGNSVGQRLFLPATAQNHGSLTYTITSLPQFGTLTADLLVPGVYIYRPNRNYSGPDVIRYTVTSGGFESSTMVFVLNVLDNPLPPFIGDVRDQELEEEDDPLRVGGGPLRVALYAVDQHHPDAPVLAFSARSSNETLVDSGSIRFEGSGTNWFALITPKDGEVGITTIQVDVSNDVGSVSTSFRVRVNPRLSYAVVDVATNTPQPVSVPLALNASGQLAGYVSQAVDPTNSSAMFYSGYGAASRTYVLPRLGGSQGRATALNASGVVVGAVSDAQGGTRAFRMNPRTEQVPTSLGTLPGANLSVATGINDDGLIVGYGQVGDGTFRAFIAGTTPITALPLTNGYSSMWAIGVNTQGEVVGHARVEPAGSTNAFLYADGGILDLGRPPGADHFQVAAINDEGVIVGTASFSTGVSPRVFLLADGTWTDLGDVLGGGASEAGGLNHFGQVVGRARGTDGAWHAFLYTDGTAIDLNDRLAGTAWRLSDARAINTLGQIAASGSISNGAPRAVILFPATEVGRRVFRPEGALATFPDIEVIEPAGLDASASPFFWSSADKKLYAVRPAVANIRWHTGTFVVTTNLTEFGESVIRQKYTNEVLLSSYTFNVWPRDPSIQVAGAPVQLEPKDPSFRHTFIQQIYTDSEGGTIDPASKVFNKTLPGYSVFHYLLTEGRPVASDLQPHRFTVTRTIAWNDPTSPATNRVMANVPWPVGTPVTNPLHRDYPGLNGYILSTNAYYDGAGTDAAYNLTNRTGPIIPVNANANGSLFRIVWYAQDSIGVAWPSYPYQYALNWPTNPPALVIASGQGSGLLPSILYPEMRVYSQPDAGQPGYNPNEEHAFLTGGVLYALRDDLNDFVQPRASDPYTLLKYRDPATGAWAIKVYQVLAERPPYFFRYDGVAGRAIQPPVPLSILPLMSASNRVVSGPAWRDYLGRFYAGSAGQDGGEAQVVLQYFYPLQPEFFFDLNRDGKADRQPGEAIPWLAYHDTNALGAPIKVHYSIQWPSDVAAIQVGQTLTSARNGLPDIADMASAEVIFDGLDPQGTSPRSGGVRLFDPMSDRAVKIEPGFKFPTGIRRQVDVTSGKEIFPDLPYYLRVRLFHDAQNRLLVFRGYLLDPGDGSDPITLVNVMTAREMDAILALDGSGDTDFKELVQSLYQLTRNPNRIDIAGSGLPAESLMIGLTTQVVTNGTQVVTNIVREDLQGAKALTAYQPIPAMGSRAVPAIHFPNGGSGMTITSKYAAISNDFTVEFWVRPEVGRPTTPEAVTGISGLNGQPYAVYPDHGFVVSNMGGRTAAGVSVGTNGISVFEHAAGQLYSSLVYNADVSGWHHVAVVYTGARPTLYVDGALVRVGLQSLNSVQPSAGLVNQRQTWGQYGAFAGDIADFRIWDHPRTQAAIQANRTMALTGTELGLVGLFQVVSSDGLTVNDASPTANPGTLVGGAAAVPAAFTVPGTPRYVVVAENNDPSLAGLPVGLHVIRMDDTLAPGSLALIQPDNVLDERVTLRHKADFAGQPENFTFEWYYQVAGGSVRATDVPVIGADGSISDLRGWTPFPVSPADGTGVNDITLGGAGASALLTLSDSYFVMRYGFRDATRTNWSGWIGDPSGTPGAPRAMFVPGWVNRVTHGLTLFGQRSGDFENYAPNTLASTLASAGPRFEGDVALNPSVLDSFGLIEIYTTVLNRARGLSIDGNPPVADYQPANQALLLAAGNIAEFYTLHANEAFADVADPTIGLTTDSTQLGSMASSLFAFQNQVGSLLEEELALLRGRDDRFAGVGAAPVYNRLFWNFTGRDGETAYVAKYGIPDQNGDGFINAEDARILFPQGHGDAWGHYLTALTTYYDLLRHPNFDWTPRPEETLVGGVAIEVNYQDERRFAQAAASRAQTGAEIVDRTYRVGYTGDAWVELTGQPDPDPQRAWSPVDWARRTLQGGYFDWVTGNAILPAIDPDPSHTGIERVDRTTVGELSQIVTESGTTLSVLDRADAGLNPLGFARGVVPFDLNPDLLDARVFRQTHFEQIYERAVQALRNAETTFNRASSLSSELRKQQNSVSDYSVAVADQESAFNNELIAIYGYAYAGDTGPGGTYSSGYSGPDLTHFMYVDTLDVTPENTPAGGGLEAVRGSFKALVTDWGAAFSADTTALLNPSPSGQIIEATFPLSTADYAFQAPSSWGRRRAEGQVQEQIRAMVLAQAQVRQALGSYSNALQNIKTQAEIAGLRYQLNSDITAMRRLTSITSAGLNALIAGSEITQVVSSGIKDDLNEFIDGVRDGIAKNFGLSNDVLFMARLAASLTGQFSSSVPQHVAEAAEILGSVVGFAKEEAEQQDEFKIERTEFTHDEEETLKELEMLVRDEAVLRVDVFNANQNLIQAARTLEATLAEGQRLLIQRTVFRKITAGTIQADRYRDLGLRIFRNDALQKYDAQFELAARYVHLAAAAYDYELNVGDGSGAGSTFGAQIVRERNLGELVDGQPVVGRVGIASILGRMRQNFDVLKGQLGLNNSRNERSRFSLRTEAFRILPPGTVTNGVDADSVWRKFLQDSVVTNLWEVPEFRRHCRPFAPESAGPQPGIVLRFGTTIESGLNFFGWPLGELDSSYDPSEFATRIRSLGVWFTDYDAAGLATKPRVYLVPVGTDRLRSSDADDFTVQDWQVIDQQIPVPFPLGAADLTNPLGTPLSPGLDGSFTAIRRHSAFRAYQDSVFDAEQFTESSRLVGRSAWNTQWVLIIPGSYLLGNPQTGLNRFIQSVDDIKLYFQTYSVSGN